MYSCLMLELYCNKTKIFRISYNSSLSLSLTHSLFLSYFLALPLSDLSSGPIDAGSTPTLCLSFYYILYGRAASSLSVQVLYSNGTRLIVFDTSVGRGRLWQRGLAQWDNAGIFEVIFSFNDTYSQTGEPDYSQVCQNRSHRFGCYH